MKKTAILICIVLLMMTTYAMAAQDPNRILNAGYNSQNGQIMMSNVQNNQNLGIAIEQITLLLGAAGVGVGVCVGVIYAIMWVTATPSKKADLKERAYPLVLGVILLFGGAGIAASFISGISKIL